MSETEKYSCNDIHGYNPRDVVRWVPEELISGNFSVQN
jgi:hypothetical protein